VSVSKNCANSSDSALKLGRRHNKRQRVQIGLVILFSAFTGSRLNTLLIDDNSSYKDSRESLIGDISINTLAYNSDRDTLVNNIPNLKARNIRLKIICYGDIDLFLLRNPDNLNRDILMAEVEFRNLKNKLKG
jgi:hypothetical protein